MLKHSFIFNGKSSLDYGIIIATHPESRHAERRGVTSTVPGRHGALYRDEAAFSTYEISYDVLLDARNVGDMYHLGRDLSAWLLTASGYCRLEDTYEPEHYRMARYVGSPDVANILFKFGRAELEFEVQPQRYLKSGEQEITLTEAQQTLYNPTAFAAAPLIRVDMAAEGITEEEPVEPVEVELEFTQAATIRNSNAQSDIVHKVTPTAYDVTDDRTTSLVSQAIDVSAYETAVITTRAFAGSVYYDPYAQGVWDLGAAYSTCYTFLDEDGEPVDGIRDTYELKSAAIPIPLNAKYLYICAVRYPYQGAFYVTPSVTLYPAPTVVGSGKVTVNGQTASIRFSARSTVYLDCEAHNAYYADGSSANAAVSFTDNENPYATFPELDPGENLVSIDGTGVTASIRPRWWTL